MKRLRSRRAEKAALRNQKMTLTQVTTAYWRYRDERRWDRIFMAMMLAGGILFFASSNANDHDLTRQQEKIAAQQVKLERLTAQAQRTADEVKAARAQSQQGACVRDNLQRQQAAISFREAASAFVASIYDAQKRSPTPEEQAQITDFIAAQGRAGQKPFPHRKCDDLATVKRFYETQPDFVDTEPCVMPDERGVCQ